MKRTAIVWATVAMAGLAGGGVMLARQAQQEGKPGFPTTAKLYVMNKGPKEAVPVSIEQAQGTDAIRVQVAGTTPVQIAGTPNVQARRSRQNWEYRQMVLPAGQDPTASLNAAGLDGWEATGIALAMQDATRIILKRPTDR